MATTSTTRTRAASTRAKIPATLLGIDIGGTGIKGATVDTATGEMTAERFRLETPQPATPEAVVKTVAEVAKHFDWTGPIGVGFPAALREGVVLTAANIDKSWIGQNAAQMIAEATGSPKVVVGNDADVAGYAEMHFGAGKGNNGLILVCTLGTGIGTALFYKGVLIPNTELGHIEIKGQDAEEYAAESAREREDLSWEKWARRVDRYLLKMQSLFWPDLIILGGGVSKKDEKFIPLLTVTEKVPVVPAGLRNEAGIVGAAMASLS
jgi:polyphosphate glucokinase